jgi:pimeloyl-ACP methyl ester carboxylesterase
VDKINANGVGIAFSRRGEGPALVLMHGNEADHSMFDVLSAHLAENFTVYAYDQRDCGLTDNPASSYGLADLGDDAAAFIAALGLERAHVYGSSLGGLVAQSLAARHPDRVDRLVLGNTWWTDVHPVDFNPEVVGRLAAYSVDLAANAPDIAELFFPPAFIRERPSVIDLFRGSGKSEEKRARRRAILLETESIDASTFTGPVLLLTGSEDRLIPPDITMEIAGHLRHAQMVQLDGIGHVGAIQAPDRVARTLAGFLLDTAPTTGRGASPGAARS